MSESQQRRIHASILEAVMAAKRTDADGVSDDEDVFEKFGLNSMDTFRALVRLEKELDVVIGEEPSEFERIKTLGGLRALLLEKVALHAEREQELAP